MRRLIYLFSSLILPMIFLTFNFSEAQVIPPKARGTPSSGPTIEEAQKEDYMGPKARVAVTRFQDKSAKGYRQIGDGMAEMLANALFATNRFIVLERQSLDDVLREQDLGASGRVRQETAARIGEIEGADLLIEGTITEFEPGASKAGGSTGGVIPLPGPRGRPVIGIGGIGAGVRVSHVAMIVKVIDARTGRRLASEQVEGKATDIGGLTGGFAGPLAGAFGGYSKTPMEKAIRIAIEEAVRLIVAKTPAEYYRVGVTPQPQIPSSALTTPSTPSTPPMKAPQTTKAPGQEPRIVYVKWPTVSLREGPGMNFKTLVEVKKGTALAVIEEQGLWLRVSLEDGREGWVGKATTSETP